MVNTFMLMTELYIAKGGVDIYNGHRMCSFTLFVYFVKTGAGKYDTQKRFQTTSD